MKLSGVVTLLLIGGAASLSCKKCNVVTTKIGDAEESVTGTKCDEASQGDCTSGKDVCVTETYTMKATKGDHTGDQTIKKGECGTETTYNNLEIYQTTLCEQMTESLKANQDGTTFKDLKCKVSTCKEDNCNSGFVARISVYLLTAVFAFLVLLS